MYLVYVDESGTIQITDENNYILSAVIIHESTWRKFDRKINQIKLDYLINDNPLEIELHTAHLVRNRDTAFEDYDKTIRNEILVRLSNIIKKNRCRLLSVIIEKDHIDEERKSPEWIQLWAWRILLERIEKFLEKKNDETITNYGLLCIDSNSEKIVNHINDIIHTFRQEGSMYLDCKYLIENPFFVDSNMRNLIQLADFSAWVTKRWYLIKKGKTTEYDNFNSILIDNIFDRFDKTPSGEVEGAGIKIHP